MIAPMQAVRAAAHERDRDALVDRLAAAGVVHLQGGAIGPDAAAAQAELAQLDEALASLPTDPGARGLGEATAGAELAQEAIELRATAAQVERQLQLLREERRTAAPLGDFDAELVVRLARHGLLLGILRGALPALEPEVLAFGLPPEGRDPVWLLAARQPSRLPASAGPLPPRGLGQVDLEIADLEARSASLAAAKERLAGRRAELLRRREQLAARVGWLTARDALSSLGPVVVMRGYVPRSKAAALQAAFVGAPMAVFVRDLEPGDEPPTLLVGPRWLEQAHAVFRAVGILPGYDETDVSLPFLCFLTLFSAMLIGDAGYGAVILLGALYVLRRRARLPGGPPQMARLCATIGAGAMVFGAMSGVWFALPQGDLPAVLQALQTPWLADADAGAQQRLMLLCFVVGAVHLTLAHLMAAFRVGLQLSSLAHLGWIGATWLMFLLARSMVLGAGNPAFLPALAISSVALIALFMTPWRRLKQEWFLHVMLPLNLVSNFVDVVSYLRLFAVGSAGVAVAASFNEMAARAHATYGVLAGAGVALFGHSLNLLLCVMGVLVHGVRLNTLEFSSHIGLQWSGTPYRPFGGEPGTLLED